MSPIPPTARRRRPAALATAFALAALLAAGPAAASPPPTPSLDAAELRAALERLSVLTSVLHVGAHPDDENTALLAYLARGRHARTAYLSLTRGDGGQNLIGTEQGEMLGVVRTQELLAARRLDGAEQYFTRAVDFGYSKSAAETLEVWGREEVLADVVWVVRRFRPDVIITRFPGDGRGGHGQHTASALLALEAFAAAAGPGRFPEQLAAVEPWQAKRLLWNNWRPSDEELAADPPLLALEVGAFDPLLGRSYTEIAALGRSMHKSQGFGVAARRGSVLEYLEHRAGERATDDLFDGVDTGWSRLPGGEAVEAILARARSRFRPERPAEVIPALLAAAAEMGRLPPHPWVEVKRAEVLAAIRAAAGLWLEIVAEAPAVAPGGELKVTATAINRSGAPLRLAVIELPFARGSAAPPGELAANRPLRHEAVLAIPPDQGISQPYWLREPPDGGRYRVADPSLVGLPEGPPVVAGSFVLAAGGSELRYTVPVLFRWTDPVDGERYRPLEIVPAVAVDLGAEAVVFADSEPRPVRLTVVAGRAGVSGQARLGGPPGFAVSPESAPFALAAAGDEQALTFTVTPPPAAAEGLLTAEARVAGERFTRGRRTIAHPHIPIQTLFPPAEAPLVRLDLATRGGAIGYVEGAGDDVPRALEQIGYRVTALSDADLEAADLAAFDAIVTGVRAYNTRERLAQLNRRLLDYVAGGGTLVVQYNTAHDLVTEEIGPYPLELSRGRVTVEGAPVTLLAPHHPLLAGPNRIGEGDFAGWVQERGLYFPGRWDPRYETVIAAADPGEDPLPGGLLYARYGEGVWIYAAYSFFRQLPAGVPGAYRLFVNLISAPYPK